VGLVDLSIASIRRITTALRPPMLDRLGLMSAIRWEAALFERRTGIRCRVSSRPAAFETRAHVTVLYRILLEALTNVARHASAGTIRIGVRQRARHLTMEIRDNGRGISDAAMTNPATLGLVGMRERALAAGGEVRIARLAAGGTAVVVNLPYEPGAATPGSAGPGTEQPDA
jgi:signal transduction histidine kinase